MREFIPSSGPTDKIYLFIGAIAGGLLTLAIVQTFSPTQAAFMSAIAISLLSFLSTQITRPTLWWTGTGAIGGIIIGVATVLEKTLATEDTVLSLRDRLMILTLQSIAGFLSGAILGRKFHKMHVPTIKEFLSRASALTAGLFAIVVTTSFAKEGLEVARALSSRLSATTTILVTTLIIPGIIGYLLFEMETSNPFTHPNP